MKVFKDSKSICLYLDSSAWNTDFHFNLRYTPIVYHTNIDIRFTILLKHLYQTYYIVIVIVIIMNETKFSQKNMLYC